MLIRLIIKLRALREHVDKFRIIFILTCVILFGSIAFSYFEKKEIWDAVYWVIVTITTEAAYHNCRLEYQSRRGDKRAKG